MNNSGQSFITRFAEREYYCSIILMNSDGQSYPIAKSQLVSFTIVDNLFSPFLAGTLVIKDSMHAIEKNNVLPYKFIGNGRDLLCYEIMPIVSGNIEDVTNPDLREIFCLTGTFVVTKCVDFNFRDSTCKELTLVDADDFILKEKTCDLSTAQCILKKGKKSIDIINYDTNNKELIDLINGTNRDRSIPTGAYIKELLKEGLNNKVNFVEPFDEGDRSLFFTPINNASYHDVIKYIKNLHYNDNTLDSCILSQNRYDKRYSFTPISLLFANHNDHTIEKLIIGAQATENSTTDQSLSWNSSDIFYSPESFIEKFHIDPPSPDINIDLLIKTGLISYTNAQKGIIIDLLSGDLNTIIEKYYNLFIYPFESIFGRKVISNVKFNTVKMTNKSFKYNTSAFPRNITKGLSSSNVLNGLLFLGDSYKTELRGMTSRRAGKFIDINILSSALPPGSTWPKSHMGRHLITTVNHVFTADLYSNTIETIKPYCLS